MFVSGPGVWMGLHGHTVDLLLGHNVIPSWPWCCSFWNVQLHGGYRHPQARPCPHPTLGTLLGVVISPLSFCKARCFVMIMFWLRAAEEGDDYGFYCLLELSTRVTEQLWLK